MLITPFYDKGLSQLSYTILSEDSMVIIDPARNPSPYYQFAHEHNAKIVAVIETHLHADFVSSHREIRDLTGAPIYISEYARAEYPHRPFDEGDEIRVGKIKLSAINTPGHSPDSICILLQNESGLDHALFTGDTLFVGDVGRPDLREEGPSASAATEMAQALFASLHEKILCLPDNTRVYPGHGPGSLCGGNPGAELESTLGKEKQTNPMLRIAEPARFINQLITSAQQTHIPKYFASAVALNRRGASVLEDAIRSIPRMVGYSPNTTRQQLTVDVRSRQMFRISHLPGAVNIERSGNFETWLGSVICPEESFYLIAEDTVGLRDAICRAASIGYEKNIRRAIIYPYASFANPPRFDFRQFVEQPSAAMILDVRSKQESTEEPVFESAINIPLPKLRERMPEITTDKPIVVHCSSGYRSAIAASLLRRYLPKATVYDMGDSIADFKSRTAEK
jgi:hydroxyacylglutathione hydrolase